MMRAVSAAALCGVAAAVANPEELVDIRWGAQGEFQFSRGNQIPIVTRPWGFNGWSVATENDPNSADSAWWWKPIDRHFLGVRCTHRPSPWISDWGHFMFLPMMVGGSNDHYDQASAYAAYNPETSEWRPYYLSTELATSSNENGATRIELAPTSHAAHVRVTFPKVSAVPSPLYNETRALRFVLPVGGDKLEFSVDKSTGIVKAEGYTMSESNPPNQLKSYIAIQIKADGTLYSTKFHLFQGLAIALYGPDATTFDVKMATSLISQEQAWQSLHAQLPESQSFEQTKAAAKKEWNDVFTAIDVTPHATGDSEDALRLFYAGFYRAAQFPRFLSEFDADGREQHFSTYTSSAERYAAWEPTRTGGVGNGRGNVFSGPLVTDSGFWDAYRTVYPFLTLAAPKTLGRMVQGWINAFKEGGWLPKWASPGYRSDMVGTMGDVVLADAIVNEVPGFNVDDAFAAILKDAYAPPASGGQGREALPKYLSLGYLPQGERENVAVSLNFMLSDYSIAQAAAKLGKPQARELLARSQNYSKLFHPSGFMRSKDSSGQWVEPFDQFAWGGSYTESGPWQYRFYVPHDPKGLADLYKKNGLDMCKELLAAQTNPSTVHVGSYGSVIHEMTEMVDNCWGQYAHNNQPVHHMLYMFAGSSDKVGSSCAQTGQYWLRKAQTELYLPSIDMFSGDEDNGEMSAWFLLSAVGLYSLAPGSGEWTLGMPLYKSVTLALPGGKTLTVTSDEKADGRASMRHNASATYPAVAGVTFNGKAVVGTTVKHADLMQGGTLAFHFTQAAKTW